MKEPEIKLLHEKKLVGKRLQMSFLKNKTFELWSSFMPRRNGILNRIGTAYFSLEVYPCTFFTEFNPAVEFEKWATVEVEDFGLIPDGMEPITLPAGLYAIFIHHGPASEGQKSYEYIFREWLPSSAYLLDSRPHAAVMGDKYKKDDPDSEEELWIPVKLKE
jgi:AraC family transcriptional regulator